MRVCVGLDRDDRLFLNLFGLRDWRKIRNLATKNLSG